MDARIEVVDGRFRGAGTWQGEAWRAHLLAAELDVELNKEALLLYDVRDLMALQRDLKKALGAGVGRPWIGWRRDWPGRTPLLGSRGRRQVR